MALEVYSNREVTFARDFSNNMFKYKVGDKVTIVDAKKCLILDDKYYNKHDHSVYAGQTVTIKTRLENTPTYAPAYTVEENGYYWEEDYFLDDTTNSKEQR